MFQIYSRTNTDALKSFIQQLTNCLYNKTIKMNTIKIIKTDNIILKRFDNANC